MNWDCQPKMEDIKYPETTPRRPTNDQPRKAQILSHPTSVWSFECASMTWRSVVQNPHFPEVKINYYIMGISSSIYIYTYTIYNYSIYIYHIYKYHIYNILYITTVIIPHGVNCDRSMADLRVAVWSVATARRRSSRSAVRPVLWLWTIHREILEAMELQREFLKWFQWRF
jgi:hypothetical protein